MFTNRQNSRKRLTARLPNACDLISQHNRYLKSEPFLNSQPKFSNHETHLSIMQPFTEQLSSQFENPKYFQIIIMTKGEPHER